ncbi:hypothetical protein BV20DRAFT_949195 [Pilatotrama ljubarskyi]|nr:hypothetical protein BV20DRAFT_949195 [Pilatotrama ljubarskyi]
MNASATAFAVPAPASISQAPSIAAGATSAAARPKAGPSSSTSGTTPGGQAPTKGKRTSQGEVKGWAELVRSERVCSVGSCANVLAAGWRWKRCPGCKAAGAKRTMTASCASCAIAFTMHISAATSGQPPQCATCRRKALAPQTGILLPDPPPRSVMGPPPPKQHKRKFAISTPEVPCSPGSIIEQAMQFVHPDHRHLLLPSRSRPVPDLGAYSEVHVAATYPSIRYASPGAPHYGPRGEILAGLPRPSHGPSSPRKGIVAEGFAPPQSGRTPEESIIISDSNDAGSSEQCHRGKAQPQLLDRCVTLSCGQHSTICSITEQPSAESSSDPATQHDSTPHLKRKRTLLPVRAPNAPAERICAARACGRKIPPQAQGDMCADCGFLLWRKQFRARVAGLSASVSSSTDVWTAEMGSAEAMKHEPVRLGGNPLGSSLVHGATTDDPMDCSEEDEPLAIVVERKRRSTTGSSRTASTAPTPTPQMQPPLPSPPVQASAERRRDPASVVASDEPADPTPSAPAPPRVPTPPLSAEAPQEPTPPPPPPPAAPDVPANSAPSAPRAPSPLIHAEPPREPGPPRAVPDEPANSSPSAGSVPLPVPNPPPSAQALREPTPPPAVPRPRIRLILRPPAPPPSLASDFEDQSSDSEEEDDYSSASPSSPTSRSSSPSALRTPKLSLKEIERMTSLAWDSDGSELTPIEDLMDMGESEVNSSESEDEAPATPKDSAPSLQAVPQGPWPPPCPPKHRGICGVVRCMNLLVHNTRMKFCYACQSRKRSIQQLHQQAGAIAQDEVEDEGMIIRMPPDGDLTGYRKCGKKFCKRLIPPEVEYRWRTCPPCRVYARNRARRMRARPPAISDNDDEELFASMSRRASRAHDVTPVVTAPPPRSTSFHEKPLPEVPVYQHFTALLDAFRARFAEFTVAQIHYLRFRAQQEADTFDKSRPLRNPIVFRFDGEYSVVADPSGGLVDAVVHCVLRNVQAALGLNFTPVGVNPGPESSVIAVLRCLYGAQVPLKASSSPSESQKAPVEGAGEDASSKAEPKPDSGTLTVKMVGELQVCVAWDRRHRFFPGQRILVRFRLVG